MKYRVTGTANHVTPDGVTDLIDVEFIANDEFELIYKLVTLIHNGIVELSIVSIE